MSNRYQFKNESGEHLHLLDGKPLIGTSTALKVLAKPLTWWASGLAVGTLGWIKPLDKRKKYSDEELIGNGIARLKNAEEMLDTLKELTPEEYVALLDKAYRAHAESLKDSAEGGTDMHADLETYIKDCMANNNGAPIPANVETPTPVFTFAMWAEENVNRFLVSEGHCYSERLWTGGITDCVAELKNEQVGILDFKSSKEAYLSQFFQTAGYEIGIRESGIFDAEGNRLCELEKPISFYAVFPFGAEKVEPQFEYDTAKARKGFECAVELHKLINN